MMMMMTCICMKLKLRTENLVRMPRVTYIKDHIGMMIVLGSEWYSAEDPVKGFELITIWSDRTIESSLEMAELENSSPHEAEMWLLRPILLDSLTDGQKVKAVGFASQLSLLVAALEMSFEAQFLEDFVSVEASAEKMRSSAAIPPPTVVDRVLKELFHEGVEASDLSKGENKNSQAVKGAPSKSLFAQFCQHSLWLGNCNIRAIAMLWIEFVREVRWCWEESQPLPKMSIDYTIDLSSCVIHQKLQMLAMCIEKKREANAEFFDATEGKDSVSGHTEEDMLSKPDSDENVDEKTQRKGKDGSDDIQEAHNDLHVIEGASDRIRRGSAGVAGSMMLLSSCQRMHAPYTQDAPLMTEDMHEERLHAVAAFGDSSSFLAQLEREILLSDMSAFKAANPEAVFEDFIRWHSPGDWVSDGSGTESSGNWPPNGRLSKRMSEHGNFWRKLWNDAPALPAYEQKPLLDPNREGEKILHYLETLRPHQLLEQMLCTAFAASADTLSQASFGDLNQMKTKIDQLYLTMASMLRPLQANQLSQESEIFEDLKRLCHIFGHVERLTVLAVSLHRKFILAPRLCNAFFCDYFNFYLPRMGNIGAEIDFNKEFDQKQQVRIDERNVVADLFPPPTTTQSWRKVLSMGNLLNGHEPVLREIIFTMCDDISDDHYATQNPLGPKQDTETYRMYIEGTSNELGVALSVVSCD
ncbi:Rab3 GTPase-activating protein catalytic subunit [Bienertia sinuspersici]